MQDREYDFSNWSDTDLDTEMMLYLTTPENQSSDEDLEFFNLIEAEVEYRRSVGAYTL